MKETFRTFPSGSTRDVATGKLEYSNYIHPLADYSFAQYMKSKQIIGGEYRRGDNRQKGLGEESLFDSLCRHIEIVKLLQKGYYVYEIKQDGVVDLIVSDKPQENKGYDFFEEKEMVNELNAVRFNMQGLLLYKLGLYENVQ